MGRKEAPRERTSWGRGIWRRDGAPARKRQGPSPRSHSGAPDDARSQRAALHPAAPTRVLSGAVAVVATVILEPAGALGGLGPVGVDSRNLHPGRRAHGALGLGLGPPGRLGGKLCLESRPGVRAAL